MNEIVAACSQVLDEFPLHAIELPDVSNAELPVA